MAPGTFSVSANGPGLSDTKTFFRGFKDGYYSMTFDGIPFNDTNDPTHHSWVFFPAQTIGSTGVRSQPGIGGVDRSVDLRRVGQPAVAVAARRSRSSDGTVSYGSFNTKLFDVEFDSGEFGAAASRGCWSTRTR